MGNVVKPKTNFEEEVYIEVIKQKEGGLIEVRRERRRAVAARDEGEKKTPVVKMSFGTNKTRGALEFGGTSPSNNNKMQIEKYQAKE